MSTRGVKAEQVATRWNLGFSPSEQGCAGGHFLGLQVLGCLQPWKEKVGREDGNEVHPDSLEPPLLCSAHLTGCTCGEGDAGWGGEVGAPKTAYSCCVVGVELEVAQGIVHSTAGG